MFPKTKCYYHPLIFIFFFVLNLVFTTSIFAQKGPGFTALQNGNLEKAAAIFQKKITSKKTQIEGLLGMAKLSSDSTNENRDLLLAHTYIADCYKFYKELKKQKKQNYKSELDISSKKIKALRNGIFTEIVETAKSKSDIAYYETILKKPLGFKEKKVIYHSKHELLLTNITKKNRFDSLNSFIHSNYKVFKRYSPDLLEIAERQSFNRFLKEYGWRYIDEFKNEQPRSSVLQDKGLKAFLAIRQKGDNRLFRKFVKDHPESYFAGMATDSLFVDQYRQVKATKNLDKYITFIAENKTSAFAEVIENDLMTIATKKSTPRGMDNLTALYPSITKSNKLMDYLYTVYTKDSTLTGLASFVSKYPDFYDQERVLSDKAVFHLQQVKDSDKMYAQQIEKKHQTIIEAASTNPSKAFPLLQEMIKEDIDKKKWAVALQKVESYQSYFGDFKFYTQLVEILKRPDSGSTPLLLKTTVNSLGQEYLPVISADGKNLFFAAQDKAGTIGGEDIFVSKKIDNKWQPASVLSDICNRSNEAPVSISADGNRLIIFDSGKLAYSAKTATGWSRMTRFNDNINSKSWQCDGLVTSDGKHLMLAVRNWEGIDIEVSKKQKDGTWGALQSLGETINTAGTDRSPFLHPDMKTLYFCSDGHGGLGKLDVFKTTRLDDTWTNWTEPINLGKEINTSEKEWGYQISTDGLTAYFSSSVENNQDIYEVALPKSMRPQPVKTIGGDIIGLKKGQSADVVVKDAATGNIIAEATTNPETGKYLVIIPEGITPTISIMEENVFSSPQEIETKTEQAVINQNIKVIDFSKKENASLAFNDVLFSKNKAALKSNFTDDLNRLVPIIQQAKHKIIIEGHTDNTGEKAHNLKLSKDRANAVRNYLIEKGCNPNNIIAKGFGETKPIASNESEEGRKRNRRVQIYFNTVEVK